MDSSWAWMIADARQKPSVAQTRIIWVERILIVGLGRFRRSHVGRAGVRCYDLPTIVKLFEIRKRDRPPSESKCEIRFEQLDLDACGIDEAHGVAIRIAVKVGIMKFLPTVKLFRIDHNQQFRRFPVYL